MKKIKYIIFVFLIFVTTSFTGCKIFTSPEAEGDRKIEELLDYLNTKDSDGLKSMFCDIIKNSENFDEQLMPTDYGSYVWWGDGVNMQ